MLDLFVNGFAKQVEGALAPRSARLEDHWNSTECHLFRTEKRGIKVLGELAYWQPNCLLQQTNKQGINP